jgi:hypothetical protein
MDSFAALAKLSCTPVAGDLALSALPNAPVLPAEEPSMIRTRRLIRRLAMSAPRREQRAAPQSAADTPPRRIVVPIAPSSTHARSTSA